jgi:NTP pyrophosphatase (non-canonical NTP hydrolase)
MDKPGYHLKPIEKGVLGEASKVQEEVEEFMDAVEQGVSIMALVELADLMGAVIAYLAKHHPNMTLQDLLAMNEVTARAFRNGKRT